jgi:4-amino-4-deoxy-L-arabinose transferase-like glycosyltransferase
LISNKLLLSALRWSVVCWVVVFWRLGYVGLIDDGAHYAQLTREMLRDHSWFVPLLDGAPFIDKPVLFHWAQGLAIRFLGEQEAAVRLPSAVAGVGLFAFTRWTGVRLFDPTIGERGWLMLATIPATFVLGRIAYLDMVFTMFTFGGMACLLVASLRDRPRLQYAGYALLALAVMTKGPIAIVLAAVFLGLGWAAGGESRRAVSLLSWKTGLLGTIVVASPWFVWMYWQFGDEFVRGYVLAGHLSYLSPRSSASSRTHTFYLRMFFTAFFPWSLVTLGYAVDTCRRRLGGVAPAADEMLLWAWTIAVIAVFTLAQFRVDRYIFPAAPACCLLAARAWVAAKSDVGWREYPATRIAIFALALFFVLLAAALAVSLPGLALNIPKAAFLLPASLALGGVAMVVTMLRNDLRPPTVLRIPIGMMVVVYGLIVTMGFPLIEEGRPVKEVGRWLRAQSVAGDSVGLYGPRLRRWEPALRYYATRPVRRLDDENDARAFLASSGNNWVVMRKERYDELAAAGVLGQIAHTVPAIVGTSGRGLRRQIWSDIVVVRKVPE